MNRRELVKTIALGSTGFLNPFIANPRLYGIQNQSEIIFNSDSTNEPEPGERPEQHSSITVLNPLNKVPLSFIIDDSTCLVNLAHYCIPQFAEVFPSRYKQDWKKLPREIPDDFVRKFSDWCGEREIKGKYSIVPYPACVGWVDREMPGWSRKELEQSIRLVQDRLIDNWDIHPEMISHTWAVNTQTGRTFKQRTERYMENWGFSVGLSPEEMTDYLAYALNILKNAGFYCDGVTTPGGFGNRSRRSLSLGTLRACKKIFNSEIPHYFRHLYVDNRSVAPRVEYARAIQTPNAECVVSIIGCTGDWFGGWDGLSPGNADQFITSDLKSGRMVEVIEKGEPAIMVCHWPGIYYNGEEIGFNIFKTAVERLHRRFAQQIHWLKLSEISRYWAAKELSQITRRQKEIEIYAPFACPNFTFEIRNEKPQSIQFSLKQKDTLNLTALDQLKSGTFAHHKRNTIICVDLPKGKSRYILD